jgi:uncharacterized protein YciI
MADAPNMDHDFLGKELYVIFSTPLKPREELAPVLPEHLAHQVAIEKKGILFGAGPMFEDGAKSPIRGMIIVRAANFDEARAIAESDPFHKAGLRSFTVEKWILNEGSYTVTVNYSDQTATID